jgi:hypothetical protein
MQIGVGVKTGTAIQGQIRIGWRRSMRFYIVYANCAASHNS